MKISFELGGNAPFIVFDDADLEVAVKALINTKFRNAGQACIASNRVLVHEKIYDEFASMLVKKVSKMEYGDGMDRNVAIGRLHSSLFYLSFFFVISAGICILNADTFTSASSYRSNPPTSSPP